MVWAMNHFKICLLSEYERALAWNFCHGIFECRKFFFSEKRVPFNWKTPFGYSLYMIFFTVGGSCLTYSATTTMSLCIGAILLFISFIDSATNDLICLSFDENSKRTGLEVKTHFFSIVHTYWELKELSAKFFLCAESKNDNNDDDSFISFRLIGKFNTIHELKIFVLFSEVLLSIFTSTVIFLTTFLVEYLNYRI